jgi:hypothetical protein
MTNDPPIAEQWHAALDGRERSEAPVYVPDVALAAPGQPATGGRVNFRSARLRDHFWSQSRAALLACEGVQGEAMRPEMGEGG